MKVLVTGATGFLGSHLVSRLVLQGDQVRAFARKTSRTDRLPAEAVEVVHGDLKDRESLQSALEGVDIVYHAGAAMSGSWREYEESTIKGTERMLELSLEGGVKRFVHISSLVVYQVYGLEKNAFIDETCPYEKTPEKVGPYAYSKVEAEKLVFRFYKKGLPVVVVRPGLVYGPRGKVLFPHVGYLLRHVLFIIIGKGDNLIPFTYVDNTVDAILAAGARKEAVGHAYHIVDEEGLTQKAYLKRYMAATHSKFLTMPVPFSLLLFLVGLIEQLRSLGILKKASSPSKYGLISKWKSLRFDTSKARRELDWRPRVSLEEGLRRTFNWYNSENAKSELLKVAG